ncbi:hypothetical protein GXW83_32130 [Streptacidiphilus sp. PB12-B1b]|uniref:hypothetical protein n=1 Tax=Streptacidiphilus sp. PB12-B1b TaxID=2705012 RepID=UPI0015FA4F20|nr:hypothetical protein [Streptacidiphilus sp. PB12-B1b]QMU79661.1 hypothetical protein GXW83_32130 [Streptacidiphilus sp. PB12-B1b]
MEDGADAGEVAEDGGPGALLQDDGVAAGPGGEVAQGSAAGGEQGGAQFAVAGGAAAEDGEPGDRAVVGGGLVGVGREVREAPGDAVGGVVVLPVDADGGDLLGPPVADRPQRVGAGPEQPSAEGAQVAQDRLSDG